MIHMAQTCARCRAGCTRDTAARRRGEKIDYEAINKIKEQGLQPQNSKVMEIRVG